MINSMTFEFGNNPGQYPINGCITDSIFEVAELAGIAYETQYFSTSVTQGVRFIDYSNLFTPNPGDKVRVFFVKPIILQNA